MGTGENVKAQTVADVSSLAVEGSQHRFDRLIIGLSPFALQCSKIGKRVGSSNCAPELSDCQQLLAHRLDPGRSDLSGICAGQELMLPQSLVIEVPHLKWGTDDTRDQMLGRALTYLVLYSTLGMMVRTYIAH